jgi:hypothetical protein
MPRFTIFTTGGIRATFKFNLMLSILTSDTELIGGSPKLSLPILSFWGLTEGFYSEYAHLIYGEIDCKPIVRNR